MVTEDAHANRHAGDRGRLSRPVLRLALGGTRLGDRRRGRPGRGRPAAALGAVRLRPARRALLPLHRLGYRQAGPQGRGLGGGSTVNSAAALRGQPWCYDGWQAPGWSWADCLEGFRGIEADQQYPDAAYHGADGLIPVTRLEPGPLDVAVFD
jgi:choline dehydrogenase-like flavoprotein